MKLEITYIAHAGVGAAWNLQPAKHYIAYADMRLPGGGIVNNFSEAIQSIRETGFRKMIYSSIRSSGVAIWIPPSAIIELKEYRRGKS